MKKVYNINFSPTGTSMEVAEEIIKTFGCEETVIDLCEEVTEEIHISSDSLCVFPFRATADEYLKQQKKDFYIYTAKILLPLYA